MNPNLSCQNTHVSSIDNACIVCAKQHPSYRYSLSLAVDVDCHVRVIGYHRHQIPLPKADFDTRVDALGTATVHAFIVRPEVLKVVDTKVSARSQHRQRWSEM